jgi:diguanylate cyclase (GGDEF)-like protein
MMNFFNRKNIFYILLCLATAGIISWAYASVISRDTRSEIKEHMQELSRQNIQLINTRINGDMLFLKSLAETLAFDDRPIEVESMRDFLQRKQSISSFGDIVLVNTKGEAIGAVGRTFPDMRALTFFKQAMEGKINLQSGIDLFDYKQTVVRLAVPINRAGKIIGVIYGTYLPDDLKALLSTDSFDGRAKLLIISEFGEIISNTPLASNYRSIEDFATDPRASFTQSDYQQYYQSLRKHVASIVSYTYDDQEYINAVTPMNLQEFIDDTGAAWNLSIIIPYELIADKAQDKIIKSTAYAYVLLLIVTLLLLALYRMNSDANDQLHEASERIAALYRTIPTPIIHFRMEDGGIVLDDNRSFANLVGCPHETCQHRFSFFTKPEFIEKIWALPDGSHNMEMLIRCYGKKYVWHLAFLEINTTPQGREVLCVLANIAQQREMLNQVTTLSRTDALTGLANRHGIREQLEPLFRDEELRGALLIMDLDNFKQVNDLFGHREGDHVLENFADTLVSTLPPEAFISRYGGDEFVVFLPNTSKELSCELAGRIQAEVKTRLDKYVSNCHFGVSFGAVYVPEDGHDWGTLFAKVDELLYFNKRQNKGLLREQEKHQ